MENLELKEKLVDRVLLEPLDQLDVWVLQVLLEVEENLGSQDLKDHLGLQVEEGDQGLEGILVPMDQQAIQDLVEGQDLVELKVRMGRQGPLVLQDDLELLELLGPVDE